MTNSAIFKDTAHGGRLTSFQGVWPTVDDGAFVFHGAQVVGDVTIGAGASIWHNCVLRGDVNQIIIGTRSNIQDGTIIHVSTRTFPTIIENDVLVAHKAMLHGCRLASNAFVGMGSMVMDNAVVETDGMLAAGAMLTPGKCVKRGELWAGSPAKFVRFVKDAEIEKNRGMAEHYRQLAIQHSYDAKGTVAPKQYP